MKRSIDCGRRLLLALIAMLATHAHANSVDFRSGDDRGVLFAIHPAEPASDDTISFTHPLDGKVYSNDCMATVALGIPYLVIDDVQNIVNLHFNEYEGPGFCIDLFDPVTGLKGDFGPLAAGDWTLIGPSDQTLPFTVTGVAEPGDINFDHTVDRADVAMFTRYLGSDEGNWTTGDFDNDGMTSLLDLALLQSNINESASTSAAVPEPTAILLLLVGVLGMMTAGRRTAR